MEDSQDTSVAWCQLGAWLKNKGDIDLWSLSGANPIYGSEQTNIVVTARAMGDTCCQVPSSIISTVG